MSAPIRRISVELDQAIQNIMEQDKNMTYVDASRRLAEAQQKEAIQFMDTAMQLFKSDGRKR